MDVFGVGFLVVEELDIRESRTFFGVCEALR